MGLDTDRLLVNIELPPSSLIAEAVESRFFDAANSPAIRTGSRSKRALAGARVMAFLGLVPAIFAVASFVAWMASERSPEFPGIRYILVPSGLAIVCGIIGYPHPMSKASLVIGAPFLVSFVFYYSLFQLIFFFGGFAGL